jgi:hypothetical protein
MRHALTSRVLATSNKIEHIIIAEDKCSDSSYLLDEETYQQLLELPDEKCEDLPGKLPIFIGMPLLITENIFPKIGIANGTTVRLVAHSSEILIVLCDGLDMCFEGLPANCYPLERITKRFQIETISGSKISIERKQFPVIPNICSTDYKAQGMTLQSILADIRKPPTGHWERFHSIYVILSRVTKLHGLHFLTDFQTFDVKPPQYITNEYNRLKSLDITNKT